MQHMVANHSTNTYTLKVKIICLVKKDTHGIGTHSGC